MLWGNVRGPVHEEWSGKAARLAVLLVMFPEPFGIYRPISCWIPEMLRDVKLPDHGAPRLTVMRFADFLSC